MGRDLKQFYGSLKKCLNSWAPVTDDAWAGYGNVRRQRLAAFPTTVESIPL